MKDTLGHVQSAARAGQFHSSATTTLPWLYTSVGPVNVDLKIFEKNLALAADWHILDIFCQISLAIEKS